ncbi:MAG: type II toxin-antitoxin system RelE/ParE family toxin [Cyclobacteriaceae bacterium]|nr:type II toxin-antitoxin system RelE/ParE family toxin [Cyclobacteriaceae bacterium]
MPLPVRYSLRARQEEIEILEYVQARFGQNTAREVYESIEQTIEKIAVMPGMFPSSKKQKGLRKCVLSKQTSIYYRVSNDWIEVVSFRANLKDPGKFSV